MNLFSPKYGLVLCKRSGSGKLTRLAGLFALAIGTTACVSTHTPKIEKEVLVNDKTKFSSKTYGVKSSPRVTKSKKIKKGGGRYQIGKGYKIKGKWYYPKLDPDYKKVGMASWYGPNFHGRLTANGEIYDQYGLSAAHKTMPLPSYAKVTNLENGSSVIVRVNDRGPFHGNREIDLSNKAAELLDYKKKGVAKVKVEYIGKAQMDGKDEKMLLASYIPPGGKASDLPGTTMSGTMIAQADIQPDPVANPIIADVPASPIERMGGEIAQPVLVASNSNTISSGTTAAYTGQQSIDQTNAGQALQANAGQALQGEGLRGTSLQPVEVIPQRVVANPSLGDVQGSQEIIPASVQATSGSSDVMPVLVPPNSIEPIGYLEDATIKARIANAFDAVLAGDTITK